MCEEEPMFHVPEDFDLLKTANEDPDFALGLVSMTIEKDPSQESNAYLKMARFVAFKSKGVEPLRKVNCPDYLKTDWLLQNLRDDHLNWLELSLREFASIMDMEGTVEDALQKLPADVDLVSTIFERCRPGGVHAILGWTKLEYLGLSRVKPMDHIKEQVPISRVREFLGTPFTFPHPFLAALAYEFGMDDTGREYMSFRLLDLPFAQWGPEDSIDEHEVGTICICADGTFETPE